MISVIVPIYNIESYLRPCLDSVISQTYKDLEIILVDDGSTDCCGAICDEYASQDFRIRVIHQENRGLSGARNAGLDAMTGSYVAFLDGDDLYAPEMLESLMRVLQANHAELSFCASDDLVEGSDTETHILRYMPCRELYTRDEVVKALLNKEISNTVWNKLYETTLWVDLRFPEGHVYEDVDVTYQILHRIDHAVAIPKVLVTHRTRNGSIAMTPSLQYVKDRELAYTHMVDFFAQHHAEYSFNVTKEAQKRLATARISIYRTLANARNTEAVSYLSELRKRILEDRQIISDTPKKMRIAAVLIYYTPGVIPFCARIYSKLESWLG